MMRKTLDLIVKTSEGNMREISRSLSELKMGDVIHSPSLRTLEINGIKKSDILKVLDLHIVRFQKILNIKEPMNNFQIEDFVYSFIDKFNHESIEDLLIVLKKAENGEFTIYNRLDKSILFQWFAEYLEMKAEERRNYHQSLKNQTDENMKSFNSQKEIDEFYKKGMEYLERRKQREKSGNIDEEFQKFRTKFYGEKIKKDSGSSDQGKDDHRKN